MPTTLAAFDWDGTLTRRDCVVPFLVDVAGAWSLVRRLGADPVAVTSAAARRNRDRLKALGVAAAFANRPVEEVAERGRRFAGRVRESWLRPDTLARLRWHQAVGHRVVIVSASLAPYLEPLGEHLGVDAVICTRLGTDDGRYTGHLEGPNCRGVHKVQRLEEWRTSQPDELHLGWAYGDSSGDDALLEAAQRRIRVGRARLEAVPVSGELSR